MRLAFACLILVTGCDLYFTDGDDDPPCAVEPAFPSESLRNPDTGQCEDWGFGQGGCGCGSPCAEVDVAPNPDWGSCFAGCEQLDELACIEADRCRAVYDANSLTDEGARFMECWSIAPSGPAIGSCEGLDAYQCSQHENCSAFYDDDNGFLVYSGCRPEQTRGCFGDEECGNNAHCSTSDGECLPPPGCEPGGNCPAVCYGKCISDGDVCSNVSCDPGAHCEAQCAGGSCQPMCVPDQNLCAAIDCAAGFTCVETCQNDPGNPGCGICDAQCVPVGTCEGLATEPDCVGRADCRAVYTGTDCTCTSNGNCSCEVLTYERCEAK